MNLFGLPFRHGVRSRKLRDSHPQLQTETEHELEVACGYYLSKFTPPQGHRGKFPLARLPLLVSSPGSATNWELNQVFNYLGLWETFSLTLPQ